MKTSKSEVATRNDLYYEMRLGLTSERLALPSSIIPRVSKEIDYRAGKLREFPSSKFILCAKK